MKRVKRVKDLQQIIDRLNECNAGIAQKLRDIEALKIEAQGLDEALQLGQSDRAIVTVNEQKANGFKLQSLMQGDNCEVFEKVKGYYVVMFDTVEIKEKYAMETVT